MLRLANFLEEVEKFLENRKQIFEVLFAASRKLIICDATSV